MAKLPAPDKYNKDWEARGVGGWQSNPAETSWFRNYQGTASAAVSVDDEGKVAISMKSGRRLHSEEAPVPITQDTLLWIDGLGLERIPKEARPQAMLDLTRGHYEALRRHDEVEIEIEYLCNYGETVLGTQFNVVVPGTTDKMFRAEVSFTLEHDTIPKVVLKRLWE